MHYYLRKLSFLAYLLVLLGFSCQEDDLESNNALNQNQIELFKNKILQYTNKLSHSLSNPTSRTQVQSIETNIDFNSMEVHKLSNVEQVITADFALNTSNKGIGSKSKYLFFIHDNQIMRSKIITFNDNGFTNHDELLLSVLDRKYKKPIYTGTITISSITNKKIHQTTYLNGKLVRYASVMVKKKNSNQQSRGVECYSYYWVTRDFEGNESWEYLYTDCTQDQVPYDEGGGGGGGGGTSNPEYTPTFPSNPVNNQTYNFYDPYGTYIQYKYNATTHVWQIVSIQIAAITITNNPYSTPYPYLLLTNPHHGQEVTSPDGLLFTYDANSGFWYGEPYEAKTPCSQLTGFAANSNVKNALTILETNLKESKEYGYYATKNASAHGGINPPIPAEASQFDPNRIKIPTGGNYIGAFHTHPPSYEEWVPMFSDGDINYLFWIARDHDNGGQPKDYSDYFLTLTVTEGTFAIKITDWNKFMAFRNHPDWINKQNGREAYLPTLNRLYEKIGATGNINDIKNAFLKTLKDYDAGIGLYEVSTDLNSWNELEQDLSNTNNPPSKKPCN